MPAYLPVQQCCVALSLSLSLYVSTVVFITMCGWWEEFLETCRSCDHEQDLCRRMVMMI